MDAHHDGVRGGPVVSGNRPSPAQRRYLERGLAQPGGKLPLFDLGGREIGAATVRACIREGWAEPWFANPTQPEWLVCKLTRRGRAALGPIPVDEETHR